MILVDRLDSSWQVALSQHFDANRPIRVGVLAQRPVQVVSDTLDFPQLVRPVQKDDAGETVARMGRGALAVQVEIDGTAVIVVVVHLKSKLLSYPAAPGRTRFNPRDEQERARYAGYALHRRAAEAVTTRGLVDEHLDGMDGARNLVLVGDLNDEPGAATTQILSGPPGSQLGNASFRGFNRPDKGDATRLWNLAPLSGRSPRYVRSSTVRCRPSPTTRTSAATRATPTTPRSSPLSTCSQPSDGSTGVATINRSLPLCRCRRQQIPTVRLVPSTRSYAVGGASSSTRPWRYS